MKKDKFLIETNVLQSKLGQICSQALLNGNLIREWVKKLMHRRTANCE